MIIYMFPDSFRQCFREHNAESCLISVRHIRCLKDWVTEEGFVNLTSLRRDRRTLNVTLLRCYIQCSCYVKVEFSAFSQENILLHLFRLAAVVPPNDRHNGWVDPCAEKLAGIKPALFNGRSAGPSVLYSIHKPLSSFSDCRKQMPWPVRKCVPNQPGQSMKKDRLKSRPFRIPYFPR